jgi:hypothetical protein
VTAIGRAKYEEIELDNQVALCRWQPQCFPTSVLPARSTGWSSGLFKQVPRISSLDPLLGQARKHGVAPPAVYVPSFHTIEALKNTAQRAAGVANLT